VSRRWTCESDATELRLNDCTPAVRLTWPPGIRLNEGRRIRPIRSPPIPLKEVRGRFSLVIVARFAWPVPPLTVPVIVVKTVVPRRPG